MSGSGSCNLDTFFLLPVLPSKIYQVCVRPRNFCSGFHFCLRDRAEALDFFALSKTLQ